jgi:hypothetical protein
VSDILQRATALIQALGELLGTDTAQALPEVADQLGASELLNAGVDALVTVLGELNKALSWFDEEVLAVLEALGGLLGLLEPLVGALGGMLAEGGRALADLGLDQVITLTDPMTQGFDYVESALRVGSGLTVDETHFEALQRELVALSEQFSDLKVIAA